MRLRSRPTRRVPNTISAVKRFRARASSSAARKTDGLLLRPRILRRRRISDVAFCRRQRGKPLDQPTAFLLQHLLVWPDDVVHKDCLAAPAARRDRHAHRAVGRELRRGEVVEYERIVVDHHDAVLRPHHVIVDVPDREIEALVLDDLQRRIALRPGVEIFLITELAILDPVVAPGSAFGLVGVDAIEALRHCGDR